MGNIRPTGIYFCDDIESINIDLMNPLIHYVKNIPGVHVIWNNSPPFLPDVDFIGKEIAKHNIERIIIIGHTPGFCKLAFAEALKKSGMDPEDVNIIPFHENLNAKDDKLILAEIFSLLHEIPAEKVFIQDENKNLKDTLVIGAGIAGIQASLEIAESGNKVFLLEKTGTIGGHMAMFDKTFPTLDCAACILTPKMVKIGQNPFVELMTLSEVQSLSGEPGNYEVKILQRTRRVDIKSCIGCGICAEKCPSKVSSEFDSGTTLRKAIYVPFPQAVPNKYLIDEENCTYVQSGKCGVCAKVCPAECINLDDKDKEVIIKVGNIIVATGFNAFDASKIKEFGYGKFPNVLTALEFERLINASGPTEGNIKFRKQDKKGNWIFENDGPDPDSIALIHCVGSRDQNHNKYCSRVCCMYSLKLAHLVKEKLPKAEVIEYYIDMRAFGKGYEEFYDRIKEEGVHMIRGRTATIKDHKGRLRLRSEDIINEKILEKDVDMVILAIALEPGKDTSDLSNILGIKTDTEGWFTNTGNLADTSGTNRGGIVVAGACQGPKDIPDSVAQGSAAAAKVLRNINTGIVRKGLSDINLHDVELKVKELITNMEEGK